MSLIKYGDVEPIQLVKPSDIEEEDTKQKLDDLKADMDQTHTALDRTKLG